jgi:hypothetical protein
MYIMCGKSRGRAHVRQLETLVGDYEDAYDLKTGLSRTNRSDSTIEESEVSLRVD